MGIPLVLQVDLLSLTLLRGREQDRNTQGKLLNLTGDFLVYHAEI